MGAQSSAQPTSKVLVDHPPRQTSEGVIRVVKAAVRQTSEDHVNDVKDGQSRADRCTSVHIKAYMDSGVQKEQLIGQTLMTQVKLAKAAGSTVRASLVEQINQAKQPRGYTYASAYPVKDSAQSIAEWARCLLNPARWIVTMFERDSNPVADSELSSFARDAERHLQRSVITGTPFSDLRGKRGHRISPAVFHVLPPASLGKRLPMASDPRNMLPHTPGHAIVRECGRYCPRDRLRPSYEFVGRNPSENDRFSREGAVVFPLEDNVPVARPKRPSPWTCLPAPEEVTLDSDDDEEEETKSVLSQGTTIYRPAATESSLYWPVFTAFQIDGDLTAISMGVYHEGWYARVLLYMMHRYCVLEEDPSGGAVRINPEMKTIDDVVPDLDALIQMLRQPRTWAEFYHEIMSFHLTGVVNPFFWNPTSTNIVFARTHWPNTTRPPAPSPHKPSTRQHEAVMQRTQPTFCPFEIKQMLSPDIFSVREHYMTTDTVLSRGDLIKIYKDEATKIFRQWDAAQAANHPLRRKDLDNAADFL